MHLKTYRAALSYLNSFAYKDPKSLFPGKVGLEKTAHILAALDHPQEKLKIVHIAGTSGKGSTAAILTNLLISNNVKTAKFVSPHIFDLRERITINNNWISKSSFVKYINLLQPIIQEMSINGPGKPSYFEILFPLALAYFVEKKCDFAVIETGLGGLLDSTNAMGDIYKTCVITKIGMDHLEVLGNSLEKIAAQKAGIIQRQNSVFMLDQGKIINNIFAKHAVRKKANLKILSKNNIAIKKISEKGSIFSLNFPEIKVKDIFINTPGEFQVENAALGLFAFIHIANHYHLKFTTTGLKKALESLQIPGRMHITKFKDKTLIVDAAHNPQKMQAFRESLQKIFKSEKFTVIFALKKRRDAQEIIEQILPITSKLILTSFKVQQDMLQSSISAKAYAKLLEEMNFTDYILAKDVKEALQIALKGKGKVVVTGSMYLLDRFYKDFNF